MGNVVQTPHFQSLSEAIVAQPLDGIVISTPTPTHEPLITEAAAHGLSIFAEKPVDETAEKIRNLFEVTRRHGVELCCGFQRRFDPGYLSLYHQVRLRSGEVGCHLIAQDLDSSPILMNRRQVNTLGSIGSPLTASIFFGDHPAPPRSFLLQGGGNIISDCSAHDVDYIRWVLQDEVESVYATGTSSDDELMERGVIDNATMVMKFSRGEYEECASS